MQKRSKQHIPSDDSPSFYYYTVWIEDGNAVETTHSETCYDVTGHTQLEFSNDPYLWITMVVKEDRDLVKQYTRQILSGTYPKPLRHSITHKGGSIRNVESTIFPHYDIYGNLTSYNGMVRDITGQETNDKLSKSRVEFKLTGASALNIIYEYNIESRNTLWYGDIDTCFGYDQGKFPNSPEAWLAIIHPDDLRKVMTHYNKCFETGEDAQFSYRIKRKDGTCRHLEEHAIPIFSHDKKLIKWVGTLRDFTDRKVTAKALKESEKKYHMLFENATDAIYLIDPETQKILDCNLKASQLIGYTQNQIKSMTIGELHPVEEQDVVLKIFNKIKKEGQLSGISGINQLSVDGNIIPVELNATIIELNGKKYCLGIFRDVTEHKKSEEYLRHEKDKLINILDAMEDGVYIVNHNYDIEYINPVLKKTFGLPKEDKCYAYFHKRKSVCLWCKNKEVLTGKTVHWEWYSSKNRKTYDLIDTPLNNPDGSISKLVTLRDITKRKKMEEQLQTSSITDNLTGLLNRRGFFTLSGQQWKLSDRNKSGMSLFYFDVDNMKNTNETLGNSAGDQALMDISNILKKSFRKSDIIARISGDEFAVLIPEKSEHDIENIVSSNVLRNLKNYNKKKGRVCELSLSTGIAHYDPAQPCSVDELLMQADTLMHRNKMYSPTDKEIPILKKKDHGERTYKRYDANNNCMAELAVLDNACVKNISIGGMCLKTSHYVNTNSQYRINMHCNDNQQMTLTGEIVWSSLIESTEAKDADSPRYEAGLSFTNLDYNQNIFIKKFIDDLES